MARMASSSPHATATAVLPTPVGPTSTGTKGRSAPPKSSLQLVLRQLYDGGPPVYVVRRERRAEQPAHQLPHLLELEPLARFDRGPAREAGGEALEPVRPTAEPAAGEIRHQFLETARGVEPRVRGGGGPPGKISSVEPKPPTPDTGNPAPAVSPPTPSGAAATSGPSASRTASPTTFSTKNFSRNRTSSLAGWTLTSTASPGRSRNRIRDGRSPGAMVERYPASAARRMNGSRIGRPRTKTYPLRPAGRA